MNNQHIGSNFDDFLEEEGLLAEAEAVAIKRVIAFQVEQMMKEQNLSKTEMSRRMKTSRELATVTVPPGAAQVYLTNGSVNASQAFTTYFDNFKINSGLTTYKP